MSAPEIFDRARRRLRRARAFARPAPHFLRETMVEELLDRLDSVTRRFDRALDLGSADGTLATALGARGLEVVRAEAGLVDGITVACDEDRLPFADASFDLIVSAGALDSVNDLPGALALARRALRPDGLFLAALIGGPSLASLKAAALAADLAVLGGARARVHPQIDVRAAGDLLARVGFVLPVADRLSVDVRYSNLAVLIEDLRAMGATNVLGSSGAPVTRTWLAAAAAAFAERADEGGKTPERFELLFLTGWAPAAVA